MSNRPYQPTLVAELRVVEDLDTGDMKGTSKMAQHQSPE